jgi:hypothetical protein
VPALARLNHLAERALTTRRTERPALFAEFGISLTETSLAGKEFGKGPLSA